LVVIVLIKIVLATSLELGAGGADACINLQRAME
jgi:hypothetical protein